MLHRILLRLWLYATDYREYARRREIGSAAGFSDSFGTGLSTGLGPMATAPSFLESHGYADQRGAEPPPGSAYSVEEYVSKPRRFTQFHGGADEHAVADMAVRFAEADNADVRSDTDTDTDPGGTDMDVGMGADVGVGVSAAADEAWEGANGPPAGYEEHEGPYIDENGDEVYFAT